MNSVDVSERQGGGPAAALEQIRLISAAGVDFIEISGGSFDNPTMM